MIMVVYEYFYLITVNSKIYFNQLNYYENCQLVIYSGKWMYKLCCCGGAAFTFSTCGSAS